MTGPSKSKSRVSISLPHLRQAPSSLDVAVILAKPRIFIRRELEHLVCGSEIHTCITMLCDSSHRSSPDLSPIRSHRTCDRIFAGRGGEACFRYSRGNSPRVNNNFRLQVVRSDITPRQCHRVDLFIRSSNHVPAALFPRDISSNSVGNSDILLRP